MDIFEKIDKMRRDRGWSINNLAMEAMLTQSTVNNLYHRNTEPKISTLRSICNAFGVTLAEFFADDNAPVEPDAELIGRIKLLTPAQKTALAAFLRTLQS